MDDRLAKARQVKAAEDQAGAVARLEEKVDRLIAHLLPEKPKAEKPEAESKPDGDQPRPRSR